MPLAVALLAFPACSNTKKAPPPDDEPAHVVVLGDPGEAPSAVADRFYGQRCGACHGATGAGDGPSGAFLKPPPRNFGDKTWQTSVDDAYLKKIMLLGGPSVGKSVAMPATPELTGHDDVMTALVAKIRGFVRP